VFLNNRYMDPGLGAFISVDPLVAKTGQPYLYANGNPATLSDPSGLCSINPFSDDDCYSEAVETVVDAGAAVVDAGASVATGVYNRGATLITYGFNSAVRQGSNPLQSTWDLLTGTTVFETFSAIETIVFDDARLYKEGPYCGREAECFTGSDTLLGHGATTTGHTVRFQGTGPPADDLVAHEMQHVYDIENVGGTTFYASYLLSEAACLCYKDSFGEKPAYDVQRNYPSQKPRGILSQQMSSAWNWLSDNFRPVPLGPVFGSSSQPALSSSTSSNSWLRPKSGAY